MNRREILQGGVALSAAVFAGMAHAEEMEGHEHMHMQHSHGGGTDYFELAHAATHCVLFGEACLGHTLELLGQGERDMAACAKSVEEMLAATNMLRQLATWQSPFVPRMAKVVMDMCKACESECRKHEKKHKACHDCAEVCAACIRECAKVAI